MYNFVDSSLYIYSEGIIYVCMYLCMYVYMYVCVYVHMYVHIYVCVCIYVCIMYVHTYVCMNGAMCCMWICMFGYEWFSTQPYWCTYVLYISLLVFLIHKVTIVELMSSGRRVSDYYPNNTLKVEWLAIRCHQLNNTTVNWRDYPYWENTTSLNPNNCMS